LSPVDASSLGNIPSGVGDPGYNRPEETPPTRTMSALRPLDVQLIGSEVALRWSDGAESFIAVPKLRANSPSASVRGEHDIFGNKYGGEAPRDHADVSVLGWEFVGGYAICFNFSDGHRTGLYSYELLRQLGAAG
jgi:DUF971 family protein